MAGGRLRKVGKRVQKVEIVKRKRKTKGKMRIARSVIPNQRVIKFRFADVFKTAPTALNPDERFYSMNGMYDPRIAIGGGQPLGFDQWIGVLYNHYTVIHSKITITAFSDNSVSGQSHSCIGLTLADDAVTFGDLTNLLTQQRTTRRFLGNTGAGDHTLVSMTRSAKVGPFLGAKDPLDEPRLRGGVSSNPAEQAYWVITHANATTDIVNSPDPAEVVVEIEYTAVLTEPKVLANS